MGKAGARPRPVPASPRGGRLPASRPSGRAAGPMRVRYNGTVAEDSPEVLGQYTIYERLGRGGMATVNRAEMRGLAGFRKPVALKRLHRHIADDPKMVDMFVHEARLASHLHHPNIAQTYDLGKVDKTYFIAMEYVPGPTLTEILKQSAVAAGPVPVPIALSILSQICEALDYAHNLCDDHGKPLGIIHRDVSPANIIVSTTGVVKLIDFGIAKASTSDKTKSGMVKGKFAYMAPEYVSGGQLDLRADLFGLGVIAHELLTGRRLFHARNDFDTIVKLREMPIQPPSRWNPDIPRDLDDIVLTALQRDPALRWQSASAMRNAIANAMQAVGPRVTNQQVLEWVEWAFKQEPPKEDSGLVRVIDSLDEPSAIAPDHGHEPEAEEGDPAPGVGAGPRRPRPGSEAGTKAERRGSKEALIRTPKPAKPTPKPGAPARPRGSRRAWLLFLLLVVLAVLVRDELVVSGRALYEWCVD
jgi:serine/threonine protein kinase